MMIAVIGTIQQYNRYVVTQQKECVHIYHGKCVAGLTFEDVVVLSDNPYLKSLETECKHRVR